MNEGVEKNAYVADPCPGWQQIIIIIPMIIARAMWAKAFIRRRREGTVRDGFGKPWILRYS
jgi:hypothetical protein